MASDLKKIHAASVRILREVGIKLHHPDILDLIAGFGIKVEGQTAFFEERQLRHWMNMAPGRFTLSALNAEYNMFIGGDSTEYAARYGAPTIVDADGNRRAALMEDYLHFLKLVHQSPYFNVNGGILVQPMDLMNVPCFPLMLYASILHSDKCLMGFQSNRATVEQIMDMAAICFGGKDKLLEQPRLISMISTMSPLQVDTEAPDTLLVCAGYKQPVIISPGPAAGSTGPITMAGNIFRTDSWAPMLGLRGNLKGMTPGQKFLCNINTTMNSMLEAYQKPELDPTIIDRLETYLIHEVGVNQDLLRLAQGEPQSSHLRTGTGPCPE